MEKTANQQIVANDILRYKKNKLASSLALLGLVFNCLYFMVLYSMPRAEFTTIKIGFSVILTLIVLLATFLASEGVKGYNKKYSIVLLVLAAFQILRIFGYPMQGIATNEELPNGILIAADTDHTIGYFGYYPTSSGFFFALMVIYLVASAGCMLASAIIGWIYAVKLERFQKQLDKGEISVEETLKAIDKEEATAQAVAQPAEAQEVHNA